MSTKKGRGAARRAGAVGEWYDDRLLVNQRLARKVSEILREVLAAEGIQFDRVDARVKTRKSFLEKAARKSGNSKKYREPTREIKDVIGVRVITYLEATVADVAAAIEREFAVDPAHSLDKGDTLGTDRFGYRSKHYVVTLSASRLGLPECKDFTGIAFEIQVRSLLQHAWSEMEHDRRFKYPGELPAEFKRRFNLLAAQLEAADRDFNNLAREVDEHAARTASAASGPDAKDKLSMENATAYLRGVLAKHIPSGQVEPGLGGDGAIEMVTELKSFGIRTLGALANLFPKDFLERYPDVLRSQQTFLGLLRTAMTLANAERYFGSVWKRTNSRRVIDRQDILFFAKHGVDVLPFVQQHDILVWENAENEEHEVEWIDGPRRAIKAAIEELEWDFDEKVVRAPSDDSHSGGIEFTNVNDLVYHLNEIGFEPYNASAPRDDGEWVFEYDDSAAEEILGDECADELQRMGWS